MWLHPVFFSFFFLSFSFLFFFFSFFLCKIYEPGDFYLLPHSKPCNKIYKIRWPHNPSKAKKANQRAISLVKGAKKKKKYC